MEREYFRDGIWAFRINDESFYFNCVDMTYLQAEELPSASSNYESVKTLSAKEHTFVFEPKQFIERTQETQPNIYIDILSDCYLKLPFQITNAVLFLTEACNLKCRYCYYLSDASEKSRLENKISFMTFDLAEDVLRFLLQNSSSEEPQLCFFGGEPLLNFRLMKKIIDTGEQYKKEYKKHIHYSITTNGTLLTPEIVAFLEENNVDVTISIDGDELLQNKIRPFKDGKSSYSTTIANLCHLSKFNIRSTITRYNTDLEHLTELFKNYPVQRLYFRTALKPRDKDLALEEQHLSQVVSSLKRISKKKVSGQPGYDSIIRGYFMNQFAKINKKPTSPVPCGFLNSNITVGTDGSIYPCHALVGNQRYIIGHIKEGLNSRKMQDLLVTFFNCRNRYCVGCPILNICLGGCFYENFDLDGTCEGPKAILCEFRKEVFKIALYLFSHKAF